MQLSPEVEQFITSIKNITNETEINGKLLQDYENIRHIINRNYNRSIAIYSSEKLIIFCIDNNLLNLFELIIKDGATYQNYINIYVIESKKVQFLKVLIKHRNFGLYDDELIYTIKCHDLDTIKYVFANALCPHDDVYHGESFLRHHLYKLSDKWIDFDYYRSEVMNYLIDLANLPFIKIGDKLMIECSDGITKYGPYLFYDIIQNIEQKQEQKHEVRIRFENPCQTNNILNHLECIDISDLVQDALLVAKYDIFNDCVNVMSESKAHDIANKIQLSNKKFCPEYGVWYRSYGEPYVDITRSKYTNLIRFTKVIEE